MRSAVRALTWDIWLRKRPLIQLLAGMVVFGCLINSLLPDLRTSKPDAGLLNFHLVAAVVLLVLAIFSYTEFNPQKGTTGFPQRLFVLPVTTFQLVAVPMILGVAAIEAVILAWTVFVLPSEERSIWIAMQLGVYMVLYQSILWTMPALKSLRLLVLGLTGVFMILLRAFPFVHRLPDITVMGLLGGVAIAAFLLSWIHVARERSGVGWTGGLVEGLAARVLERVPARRDSAFRSPLAAQFWFEWRRSGSVLPVLVGTLLLLVIAPLSWLTRADGVGSQRILVAVLAMPMVLALAVGKAFSKPDFWFKDLSLPGFIAARPLSADDMVAVKLKVAAASTALSWLIVLAFLSLWLPLWANLDSLAIIRGSLWMFYHHSLYPQYWIASLLVIASVILTWRFMVGGLWLGLSGNTRVFAFSAFPYVVIPLVVLPFLLIAEEPIFSWVQSHTRQLLSIVVWIAAAAVAAKFWLAAFSWRRIKTQYVRRYLPVWLACTMCLIALAFLLGDLFSSILSTDAYRLRNLMILMALQITPLARLGLAPAFLDKNRHR